MTGFFNVVLVALLLIQGVFCTTTVVRDSSGTVSINGTEYTATVADGDFTKKLVDYAVAEAELGALLTDLGFNDSVDYEYAGLDSFIYRIVKGNSAFRLDLAEDKPYSLYANPAVLCSASKLTDTYLFCSGPNGTMEVIEAADGTVTVDTDLPITDIEFVLTVLDYRTRVVATMHSQITAVRDNNDERHERSRVAVAFIWTFMMFSMVFFLAILTAFQMWVHPVLSHEKILAKIPKFRDSRYLYTFWMLFMCLLSAIICIASGLGGFMVLGFLYFMYNLITGVVYIIKQPQAARSNCCSCFTGGKKKDKGDVEGSKVSPDSVPLEDKGTNDNGKQPEGALFLHDDAAGADVYFSRYPAAFPEFQSKVVQQGYFWFFMSVFLWGVVIVGWSMLEYQVWDRHTQEVVVEYIPEYIAKGVGAMYVYEGYAERLKMNNFLFDLSTQYCGTKYSKVLTTNADKKINIFDAFIDKYSIDMSIYERTNYEDYVSVNDWFTRPLAANVRPIAMPNNDSVIVSPADARLMCFDNVDPDSRFWIKGEDFNIEDLIGSESYKPAFENAQLSIVRLSPQDYHRFHVPASGTITRIQQIKGGLHSVNADGMTSGNYAIYNTRTVVMIQTENYGEIAYVPIGATCVGSIVLLVEEGDTVTKGDELGYFQFGGSTVAMVFEEGSVQFEEDIMLHSKDLVESLTTVNSRLATFL